MWYVVSSFPLLFFFVFLPVCRYGLNWLISMFCKLLQVMSAPEDSADRKYSDLVHAMRNSETGLSIGDRKYRLRTYSRVFVGKEAVDWLIRQQKLIGGPATSRQAAVDIFNELLLAGFIHHCVHDHPFKDEELFYRFQADEDVPFLNGRKKWNDPARDPLAITKEMRKRLDVLYARHTILADGNVTVNLNTLQEDMEFENFEICACELQTVEVEAMNTPSKLAFFINIYNVLTLHGHVVHGPPSSSYKRSWFFSNTCYNIGGHVLSLEDVEHGVLRGNRKSPGAIFRRFSSGDERTALSIPSDEIDPRIHLALNCGAKSCPPIRAYSTANIDAELNLATQAFLEGVEVDSTAQSVTLSKIFSWYKSDFGSTDLELLQWIQKHAPTKVAEQLGALLSTCSPKTPKLKWALYDWTSAGVKK